MISLELVPNQIDELLQTSRETLAQVKQIEWINVPDIMRLPIRAQEASLVLLQNGIPTIPHLRTIDRSATEAVKLIQPMVDAGLKKLVIISGDIPKIEGFQPSGETPISYIKVLKEAFPEVKFYGALDPYRQSLREELLYCEAKLKAGYDGLFSQPFFCENLFKAYLNYFDEGIVWGGISPVTSASSIRYWENVNRVVFPNNFKPGLEFAAAQAKTLLAIAEDLKQDAYLMPITISAQTYLKAVF